MTKYILLFILIVTPAYAGNNENFDGISRDIVSFSRDRGNEWHRNYTVGRYRTMYDLLDGHRGIEGTVGMSWTSSSFTCNGNKDC